MIPKERVPKGQRSVHGVDDKAVRIASTENENNNVSVDPHYAVNLIIYGLLLKVMGWQKTGFIMALGGVVGYNNFMFN